MVIETDDFKVWYDSETATVFFSGSLRLSGTAEYAPISHLLEKVLAQQPQQLKLDLQQLQFLNSSGINMLSKFVINVRKKNTAMEVVGSKDIPWQGKSLKNLQKLMPKLQLAWE
jgi:hypothetical protein